MGEKRHNTSQYNHPYSILLNVKDSRSRIVYRALIGNPLASVDSFNSWQKAYPSLDENDNFTMDAFIRCFVNLYKITNVVKLRDFQYRLLHKRVPSNKELQRWGIKSSKLCAKCGETEDIRHLLYECEHIQNIWANWSEYIRSRFDACVEVNFETVILNNFVTNPKNVIYLLGFLLKQLIYRQKCAGRPMTFIIFKSEVKLCEQIELYNARKGNKVPFHEAKWGNLNQDQSQDGLEEYITRYVETM